MRPDLHTKAILTIIALLLAALVFRPLKNPEPVFAQQSGDIYIEPGVFMLRKPDGSGQMKGRVVILRSTGDIWGFPTLVDGPYPIDPTKTEPPVSHPMYLGKFAFSDIAR